MSRPRWLWISAEVAVTEKTGLLVYSAGLSGALAASGIDITVVALGPAGVTRADVDLRVVPGELQGGWRSMLSSLPNVSYACATPELRAAIAELLASERWDAVVFDHLQVGWAADLVPDGPEPTTIFVTHNHEGTVRMAVAREYAPWTPRGLVLRFDALKAARLERRTAARAAIITSITDADRRLFERLAPTARHVTLSPGYRDPIRDRVPPMADRPRRVGIVGSFEWHVKQENLERFVTAADPVLSANGIELVIAGQLPAPFRERLQRLPSVDVVGWVDSVADFLDQCRIGLVAEPLGGGFKLKTLEYVANRVPIASLTGGTEGLPLAAPDALIEAGSIDALVEAVVAAIDDPVRLESVADEAIRLAAPMMRWEQQVTALVDAVATSATRRGDRASEVE
ncbi:MAG: glycosyltransferase [Actinomycetota bacterium]